MFKLYSKGCEYTLHALSCIPLKDADKKLTAKSLCKLAKIPEAFTRKMLQQLSQAGFLKAVRGPGGGYRLARNPKCISVLSIIEAVDGDGVFDQCVMGLPRCGDKKPCVIHNSWKKMKKVLLKELRVKSLFDLMKTNQL